jgi:hypothetical protein
MYSHVGPRSAGREPLGGSSSGRTADSDSANLGSNPSPPAIWRPVRISLIVFLSGKRCCELIPILKSKLTLSAWLAVLPLLSLPRLRVTFDLETGLSNVFLSAYECALLRCLFCGRDVFV